MMGFSPGGFFCVFFLVGVFLVGGFLRFQQEKMGHFLL